MTQLHIYVSGNVQGVFFRAHTKQKANELRLHGWVRNIPGGRVEIMAQGKKKQLRELVFWCEHEGSPASAVGKVDFAWSEKIDPKLADFLIR